MCPFNMYRSSTDIRAVWGSVLVNLNTIPPLADARLSGPGCWAYPVSHMNLRLQSHMSALPCSVMYKALATHRSSPA